MFCKVVTQLGSVDCLWCWRSCCYI